MKFMVDGACMENVSKFMLGILVLKPLWINIVFDPPMNFSAYSICSLKVKNSIDSSLLQCTWKSVPNCLISWAWMAKAF